MEESPKTRRLQVALLVILIGALIGVLALRLGGKLNRSTGEVHRLTGQPMAAFEMTDIQNNTLTSESLKGKVVLIDFWASWCGPCVAASPMVQALHEKYSDKGLVVIGANVFEKDGQNVATQYAAEHNYTFTFTHGNDALAGALGITGIPTMLVVDKQGVIRKVVVGYGSGVQADLSEAIEPLLQ